MAMKLNELATSLGCPIEGRGEGDDSADIEIAGVRGLEDAGPGHITFLANAKYGPKLKTTKASAVIASRAVDGIPTLLSANPYHDFARALGLFYQPPRPKPGVHPSAAIAATARIGEGASIGPFVSIGDNVSIGCNAVLHPHVVIYDGAEIGDDFIAH